MRGGSAKFSIPTPSQDFKWNSPKFIGFPCVGHGQLTQQSHIDHENLIQVAKTDAIETDPPLHVPLNNSVARPSVQVEQIKLILIQLKMVYQLNYRPECP